MSDVTQNLKFGRILVQAAAYRTIRAIYQSDPKLGPSTTAAIRECLRSYRDDHGFR